MKGDLKKLNDWLWKATVVLPDGRLGYCIIKSYENIEKDYKLAVITVWQDLRSFEVVDI